MSGSNNTIANSNNSHIESPPIRMNKINDNFDVRSNINKQKVLLNSNSLQVNQNMLKLLFNNRINDNH